MRGLPAVVNSFPVNSGEETCCGVIEMQTVLRAGGWGLIGAGAHS